MMWLVTINCSEDSWRNQAAAFNAIAIKYPAPTPITKKMPDGHRVMEYQIEDISDAEALEEECQQLEGFRAQFEAM